MSKLKVLFLAAEATPFTKVGGLADVAGSLPKALRELDIDVRLMIPRYGNFDTAGVKFKPAGMIHVPVGSREEAAHLLVGDLEGLPVYLIWNDHYFANRERVYGFNDDPQRFLFFSRGVIAALRALDWQPDVLHANDWHMAPVPAWLETYGAEDAGYREIATLFTIHNLAYQGICGRLLLSFGRMSRVPHLEVEPPGKVNWIAQGIAHADLVNTVSATYAREIVEHAESLGGGEGSQWDVRRLLLERRDCFFGVLNGVDAGRWNPATDEALMQTYDHDSLNMRAVNKAALQRELRLPANDGIPLLATVSRLDPIKGLELLLPGLEALLAQQDVQFVLLSTGVESLDADSAGAPLLPRFQQLQHRYPNNVRILNRFDERMARQLYGSADLFVLPSRMEPSSQSVMIGMRYGAIPVVHATGGLADTVVDADRQPSRGTGFSFTDYSVPGLQGALTRALQAYFNETRWAAIQQRGMGRDFSWQTSARAYVDLYDRARRLHLQHLR